MKIGTEKMLLGMVGAGARRGEKKHHVGRGDRRGKEEGRRGRRRTGESQFGAG